MKRKPILILLALLAAAGIAVLLPKLLPSEEKRVRKRCELLEKWGGREKESGPIALANQIRKLKPLFTDPCRLNVPAFRKFRDHTPDEITTMVLRFWNEISHASVRFDVHGIEFPDEDRCEVLTAFSMRGALTSGEAFGEHHAIIVRLRKVDGDWLFSGFEEVTMDE